MGGKVDSPVATALQKWEASFRARCARYACHIRKVVTGLLLSALREVRLHTQRVRR